MNGFTIYDDNSSGSLGLNGLLQLNPETTFGNLETSRPAFTFGTEPVDFSLDMNSLEFSDSLFNRIFEATPVSGNGSGTNSNLADVFGDYLTSTKNKASSQQFLGASLKTAASAVKVFDQLVSWNVNRDNINLAKKNTQLAADNQMAALDNQVLYVKNQLMDRFNSVVANNAVNMAARNLRVTSANLLEASKETAHDINMDFRTAESNAELQKINLRNQKKQASIAAKYAKTAQLTGFINAAAELGLNVATGGMTGQSWGQLYSGYQASMA